MQYSLFHRSVISTKKIFCLLEHLCTTVRVFIAPLYCITYIVHDVYKSSPINIMNVYEKSILALSHHLFSKCKRFYSRSTIQLNNSAQYTSRWRCACADRLCCLPAGAWANLGNLAGVEITPLCTRHCRYKVASSTRLKHLAHLLQ